MGMKSDSEEDLKKRFKELCSDLNLDKTSADEAWLSYQRIGINYTLEGEKLHWLACALYVACRKCVTQTVGKVLKIEGNLVSLTRLLRSSKLSLVQFFNKMKKWSDMANLSAEMRQKVDHLERNFNVSTVIFKKYKPIFEDVFKDPTVSVPKHSKSRKQSRKQTISSSDIFSFCWTLFIHIKSNFPQISDDLVNSYHLLLACIDYCYANALLVDNSKELLNSNFRELPKVIDNESSKRSENSNCIIQALCDNWDGISLEAKCIKEHWCKPCIKRMTEKDNLKSKNSGIFDSANFESNNKYIMKEYDQFVLNIGDFDERIFLNDNAHEELGTPQCNTDELKELMQNRQNAKLHDQPNALVPSTPLSNRQYLSNRSNTAPLTPIASATHSVSRLQSILLDRKDEPSEALDLIFKQCSKNPREKIVNLLKQMGERFLNAYNNDMQSTSPAYKIMSSNEEMRPPSPYAQNDEFAKKRLHLAITFYYKALENILLGEKKRIPTEKLNESLTTILDKETFHLSLFACSLEIILFSYNAKQTFPWILEVFSEGNDMRLHPFNFYKVIEPIIREEEGLSRDVVKHLNSIEEKILESLAWKGDSPLWEIIRTAGPVRAYVPSCQEVSLPMNNSGSTPSSVFNSPISHFKKQLEIQSSNSSSITERFSSPFKSTAKRQLFSSGKSESASVGSHPMSNMSQQGQIVQMVIPAKTESGEIQYIQVPAIAVTIQQNTNNSMESSVIENPKPVKTGPTGLFFRKVYTLAGLRLRDLCDRLNIADDDIRRKIWTCFEYSLRQHTDLMRDRHLDQIIMCAFYAICKVTKQSQTFQDIMKCYRLQPQAASHVYRSVLMKSIRSRRNSGSSDTSRNSGSNSPLMQEERDRIRSSSTLPVPHPNSQPPTPTQVAGTGSQFDFEDRGDVIMFYNNIYLPELSVKYIMKFAPNVSESPPLSPLPRLNANPMSPFRRVSQRFPVYISPLKTANFPPSPNRPMSYRFQSSPAKDLRAINNMMRGGSSSRRVSKRIFQDDTESENSPTKRQCTDTMNRKIRDIVSERQIIESNGSLSNGNGSISAD